MLAQSVTQLLSRDRYTLEQIPSAGKFNHFIEENKEKIDCLILLNSPSLRPLFNQFYEQGTILPAILLETEELEDSKLQFSASEDQTQNKVSLVTGSPTHFYHSAEVRLKVTHLEEIFLTIDRAIAHFLHLGTSCSLSEKPTTTIQISKANLQQNFLLLQQRRLAEKLKERLGYLGVYYKRNPHFFYRNLSQDDKRATLQELSAEYREIILNYFGQDGEVNQIIDRFVSRAFFADISASQILEIHMELMDDFSQQLKLEGRSEEILLDYRLVLIDILAHVAEMYRRSIPREDIPFDLFYPVD
jgi:circadian clock protein KaiA